MGLWRRAIRSSRTSLSRRLSTKTNVVSRHVLIPTDMWPDMSKHGWIGKVIKTDLRKPPSCTVKLHDGSYRFELETVFERFKPLS